MEEVDGVRPEEVEAGVRAVDQGQAGVRVFPAGEAHSPLIAGAPRRSREGVEHDRDAGQIAFLLGHVLETVGAVGAQPIEGGEVLRAEVEVVRVPEGVAGRVAGAHVPTESAAPRVAMGAGRPGKEHAYRPSADERVPRGTGDAGEQPSIFFEELEEYVLLKAELGERPWRTVDDKLPVADLLRAVQEELGDLLVVVPGRLPDAIRPERRLFDALDQPLDVLQVRPAEPLRKQPWRDPGRERPLDQMERPALFYGRRPHLVGNDHRVRQLHVNNPFSYQYARSVSVHSGPAALSLRAGGARPAEGLSILMHHYGARLVLFHAIKTSFFTRSWGGQPFSVAAARSSSGIAIAGSFISSTLSLPVRQVRVGSLEPDVAAASTRHVSPPENVSPLRDGWHIR